MRRRPWECRCEQVVQSLSNDVMLKLSHWSLGVRNRNSGDTTMAVKLIMGRVHADRRVKGEGQSEGRGSEQGLTDTNVVRWLEFRADRDAEGGLGRGADDGAATLDLRMDSWSDRLQQGLVGSGYSVGGAIRDIGC